MRRSFSIALCLCAVLVLTGCGKSVPDVRGMARAEAAAKIAAAGLTLGPVTYDEKASGTAGTVVAQQPAAGTNAPDGSAVTLTLAGPRPVAAPSLTGMSASDATAALAAAGLVVGAVEETFSATVPEGQIISQEPAAGDDAAPGTPVVIIISKGRAPVAVPDVVGKSEAEATATLAAAGLKVTVTRKAVEGTEGIVLAQKPDSGSVKAGSTVTITVSIGLLPIATRLLGSWKGSDGSTYTFRPANRVVTPDGGVVRYTLTNGVLIIRRPSGVINARVEWVTADRFKFREQLADGLGPTVTYNKVK